MGTINEFAGGERGKGRVLDHSPQAAQHGPEDPKGARIPRKAATRPAHDFANGITSAPILPVPSFPQVQTD